MDIQANWCEPIDLVDGSSDNLIYKCEDIDLIADSPGVYIFARIYGENVEPLYIGRASNLKRRIDQQFNNTRLMKGIENSPKGGRILLIGELELRPGQQAKRVLDVLEQLLIEHFLSDGYELLNRQGTKTPVHFITFSGNQISRKLVPIRMLARKRS